MTYRIREAVDPDLDFAVRIVMDQDLTDLRYLYRYGEYVTENELETARYLNSLPQEEIDRMAWTYTEGYRMGFVLGNKDLSSKKTVNIRYTLGFERMIRAAVKNFEKMGLRQIGPDFREIFQEVIRINTLDSRLYRDIQQRIIDVLDTGDAVHIQGMGANRTDLTVRLHPLADPAKQTNFENCVADVNIPVGEVFTSPMLKGTEGVLEVSEVYLNGLRYENLHMEFQDGMISSYTCSNFPSEEENRRYLLENVLYHHETLPMGEFAIGTNTTAYAVARKYQIQDKLPILIAEKMGPHFAVGDTCYSWAEDTPVFNPDGKEIIARDNEVSIRRKEDPGQAYLGCHTDITVPYQELGHIRVHRGDGTWVSIIEDGRFVLEGTEALNEPLEGKEGAAS